MLRVKEIKNNNNGTIYLDPYYIDYLCFTDASGSSNTLTLTKNDQEGNTPTVTLEYSTDKVNWTTWTETNNVRTYTIPANGKVYLRGVNPNGICYNGRNCHTFSSTKNVRASGNIMTIADGIGRRTEITRPFFARLFYQMTTLLTAPNFPSEGMSLGDSSIAGMFNGCSSLTTAPSLTVNSLSSGWCCQLMFNECTSLTDASNVHLNATNIPSSAYMQMFNGCTLLATAPSLTISSMSGTNACNAMFNGCTSLTSASNITLNATTIPNYAYLQMFNGCSALTTPPSITSSELTVGNGGMTNMFNSCSNLVNAPSMTISSAGVGSFNSMYKDCVKLTNVSGIKLNATTLANGTYKLMFSGCTELVTPPEIKATTLSDGDGNTDNGSLAYMFQNCSKLNTIKVHFTSWNSGNYTKSWTYGTKSSGTFYKPSSLPSTKNTSGNTSNPHYIPYNWTVTNI